MSACNDKNQNQRWVLSPAGQLSHVATSLCLDLGEGVAGQEVTVAECQESRREQVWQWDFYQEGREGWRPGKP